MIHLSILTPAVPSRFAQLADLTQKLAEQIGDRPVEHLVFLDNKRRTVGEKRNDLLGMANGRYVAFVDDDDMVADDYVASILAAIEVSPDVVSFLEHCTHNGDRAILDFQTTHENEMFRGHRGGELPTVKRFPSHVCAWRTPLARFASFTAKNFGEDNNFTARLMGLRDMQEARREMSDHLELGEAGLREIHIPRVLRHYVHSEETTEAPR